ncbi:START domain-containing protein [Desulfatiferula olefinivorans]
MKKHKVFVSLLTVMLCTAVGAHAGFLPEDWRLVTEKEGVTVHAGQSADSAFTTYKATGIINKPWEVLFEVLLDVPGYPTWMPGCREASVVAMLDEQPVKGRFVIHLVWDAIWPVKNRDLVIRVESVHDWENDHVVVTLNQTDDYDVPAAPGLVRVNTFFARFDFRYIDRNHTLVEFINLVDPGGVVPPMVAGIQTASVPYRTLRELAVRAGDPVYYKRAMDDYF